jgi:hypothetical protein
MEFLNERFLRGYSSVRLPPPHQGENNPESFENNQHILKATEMNKMIEAFPA